ncbi:hypothetical protein KR222_009769, partial [Zaprionus bogoriensis]
HSETKTLLNALLCDIYGKQEQQARRLRRCRHSKGPDKLSSKEQRRLCRRTRRSSTGPLARMASTLAGNAKALESLDVRQLIDVSAMLKVEILMMGYLLEGVLVARDRLRRHQEVLCEFVTAVLIVETHDAQPKMRFSLSPPPPKVSLTSPTSTTGTSTGTSINNNNNHSATSSSSYSGKDLCRNRTNNNNMLSSAADASDDAASDYNQWLHAMKLVARLPGGTPPEFRRKLWLSLADKYLKSKNVDWTQQREKCFCEEWREDDEELGIQIVKDLHRTGSNLCTGPAGSINQAKLKRILLGYARYNPEVGYCQGFNMLGALILQVMDKEEEESMKVMIYLVEGVLPTGYFYGSMGGLQADMGVFRELMQTKLPRLAKHLQRLQGPVENAYEPPLTNVFTMQWFLTMFCTCLPMSCVLRVWDLVLIEGSDVLLRTALVLWSLLEERVLNARSADEFYGKMGSFSNELLNGHLIDSNGLIERVVQLGPIADIKQLRDKHLYHIAPLGNKQGLQLYYDDEDTHSDDESRLAVTTMWGLNWGRRGSTGVGAPAAGRPHTEQKDRLALDISLLKKQYDRLRERQKQAHVILTTACSTATSSRQTPPGSAQAPVPVNQLLLGRPAIVTNKGKRVSAPLGAIPPARKPSLPAVLHGKSSTVSERQLRRGETLHWRDTDATRHRRDSLTWKEIKADRAAMLREGSDANTIKSQKLRSRLGKSDSSSYSEESDGDQDAEGKDGSSTDTSLCDDDDPKSLEKSPKRKAKLARKLNEKPKLAQATSRESSLERRRPNSWAPSTHEIPFVLMGPDSGDEKEPAPKEEEDSATESDRFGYARAIDWSQAAGDLAYSKLEPLHVETETETDHALAITSTSQLSPLPDIANYLSRTCISPLPTPKPVYVMSETESMLPPIDADIANDDTSKVFDVSDNGVTNEYFERVNSVERPNRLDLSYSLNDDEMEVPDIKEEERRQVEGHSEGQIPKGPPVACLPERDNYIPGENKDDYKEVLSMTIEASKPPTLPATLSHASRKRRDPRRKTLTRSSTIELEERFLALERRLSQEQPNRASDKLERPKYIPTTASLEARYNTLEKQISAEKQRVEDVEISTDCPEKPDNIPSTADLELRFDALAKQLSSNESNHPKAPVELSSAEKSSSRKEHDGEKQPDNNSHGSKKTQLDNVNQPAKASEKVESTRQENEDGQSEKEEKPRLKKLPSTAELEDRFNALERKMSVQKSSPAKKKEKPPDEKANKQEESVAGVDKKSMEKPESESGKATNASGAEKPISPGEKKSITVQKEVLVTAGEKIEQPKAKGSPPADKKQTDESETKSAKEEKKSKIAGAADSKEVTKRKTPPSTEELEKRFNALEKKLSTSQTETESDKENEAKPEGGKQVGEKTLNSIKSFDAKVREISVSLNAESQKKEHTKEAAENVSTPDDNQEESGEIKKPPAADKGKVEEVKPAHPEKNSYSRVDQAEPAQAKELTKRRASEPPSMEDLEKRYERLKRRMSSRNQFTGQNETVNEALERIEQEVIAELGDTAEKPKEQKKQPPTTEDLESRYEALHNEKPAKVSEKTKPTLKSPPKHVDVATEAHIPDAPPPPPPPLAVEHITLPAAGQRQQQALIEELQSKMRGQSPGEENLKPSKINPQRRRQQTQLQQRPTPMGDETSEAPANTAYYRSGNYEPWTAQQQRMVRRFSDLPSRADLENRLQFLEKKLYKRFYKQRCASDSEVASRSSSYQDEKPSTSRQAEVQLEQRVLALEKQLSENSLKLLQAVREKARPDVDESSSPARRPSSESETQGKELVRYTQNLCELDESDKPINISINIKMLLNKESEQKKPQADSSSTEDLKRRLEQLEQQLIEERAKRAAPSGDMPECELKSEPEVEFLAEQVEACRKQEKDSHNQSVKHDEAEKLDEEEPTPMLETITSPEPEAVKETKTLLNEEKAQTRNKEDETEKASKANPKEERLEAVEPKEMPYTVELEVSSPTIVSADVEAPTTVEETKKTDEESKNPKESVDSRLVEASKPVDPVDPNNKTVVLLMDNEPRALKVRRLTRANTEELEDLFQALEKQLSNRNLVKSKDGKLVRVESKPSAEQIDQAQAISDLTKEIEDFTSAKPEPEAVEPKEQEKPGETEDTDYDWGPNPVKHHLKRKTVYLPSTKELESRFRSLERQIKLLEDVEKIDVEQRLNEIERKIKLQYSLSHEKDLNKYLELCEGKGLDTDESAGSEVSPAPVERSRSPARKEKIKSPYTSPARKATTKSPYVSPARKNSPYTSPSRKGQKTPPSHTSPARTENKRSPYTSPARRDDFPCTDDLEYKYRVLDLVRSKSKENLAKRKIDPNKKPPIHPLEMLLDPSPDSNEIPTTGELEHRIRLLDEKLKSPAASRSKSRSRSPTIDDIKRQKMLSEQQRPRTPVHSLERMVYSPDRPEPPTADELDQRMRALEQEQCFDFKTQKDYKEFNQKLKDVISPSLSYEEFKAAKSREQSPRRGGGASTPKSALRRDDNVDYRDSKSSHYRPTSPKVIRFREDEEEDNEEDNYHAESWRTKSLPRSAGNRMVGKTSAVLNCWRENTKILQRILKKTLADQSASGSRSYSSSSATVAPAASSSEGLDAFGSRLMRVSARGTPPNPNRNPIPLSHVLQETSPITRTGTHTGVPLRTGDNINERLSSIKNSIKSIDTLCEEKPYRKEKCQRYIDSLFSESMHFASKKSSAEDLTHSRSESRGRGSGDPTPAIRISSEHRSLGSAESLHRTGGSPLPAAASPQHHRSHRDISRELSPRRRRYDAEEREEERANSRVRCDTMLPNYLADNRSEASASSNRNSLTTFHKIDRQLEETCARYADDDRRSASRSPLSSPYESRSTHGTRYRMAATATDSSNSSFPRPVSPYRQAYDATRIGSGQTPPVYQPAKLEIRHTTVTSTFYDRFLMEKQIEKQTLSRPPSRSPLATSPSATSKSYSDLSGSLAKFGEPLLAAVSTATSAAAAASSYSPMSRSYAGSSSSYSYLTSTTITNNSHSAVSPTPSSTAPLSVGLAPTGLSSSQAFRTPISMASTTSGTTSAFVPYNFTSSFSTRLKSDTKSSTDALSYSTGVYNPMMTFTLREPSNGSPAPLTQQFQYRSSYGSSGVKGELEK